MTFSLKTEGGLLGELLLQHFGLATVQGLSIPRGFPHEEINERCQSN